MKKPEAVVGPKLRSRGLRQLGPVQWTSSGKPKLLPEQTDTVRGEKASNASTIRTKISIKSQEPPQIKIMKVAS